MPDARSTASSSTPPRGSCRPPSRASRAAGGVGKTYLTRVICDVWEAHGGSVLLCALAGKAALRLSQSTGRLARTLARTLAELEEREAIAERLAGGGLEERERRALVDRAARLAELKATTLVIVDEASMVDVATIHRILRRTPLDRSFSMEADQERRTLDQVTAWLGEG